MPTLDRAGARLWFADEGNGSPVLLVHGGLFDPAASGFFWVETGIDEALLDAGYRIVMPDRRFSGGRTRAPFAHHTWDIEAADLAAILRQTGAVPAHVITGSNGCSAAIRLALTAPELVRSLVLCWPVDPRQDLRPAFEISAGFIEEHGPAAYLAELRAHGLPGSGQTNKRPGFPWGIALLQDEALVRQFAALPATAVAAVMRDTAGALLSGDLVRGVDRADAARLAQVASPITVVPPDPEAGSHTRAIAETLAAAIPGATLTHGIPVGPSPDWPEVLRDALARAALTPAASRPPLSQF